MIIRITATALIQCMVRTQAGWIAFAGTATGCCSAAAMLDTALLRPSIPFGVQYSIRWETGLRYYRRAIKAIRAFYRSHKKASRGVPRLETCASRLGTLKGHAPSDQEAGISTVSTTWMTPFDWCTLEIETIEESPLASTIQILPSIFFTVSSSPSAVLSFLPSVRSDASSRPGTTW